MKELGPTYVGDDPVSGRTTYYGTEVSRTTTEAPAADDSARTVDDPSDAGATTEAAPTTTSTPATTATTATAPGVAPDVPTPPAPAGEEPDVVLVLPLSGEAGDIPCAPSDPACVPETTTPATAGTDRAWTTTGLNSGTGSP